jgi:hypothetical protein
MSSAQHQAVLSMLEHDQVIPEVFSKTLSLEGKLSIAFPSHTACAGETMERVVTKDVPSIVYKPFNGDTGMTAIDRYTL